MSTTTSACSCNSETVTTTISPLTVTPITSTDAAANNYSIKYTMKKNLTNGQDEAIFTGQLLRSNGDLVDQMMDILVEIVSDMIRSSAISTYTNPTGFDDSTELSLFNDFRNFFLTDGSAVTYDETTVAGKKLVYIVDNLYNTFVRIKYHIETFENETPTCPQILNSNISSCFYDFELIYN